MKDWGYISDEEPVAPGIRPLGYEGYPVLVLPK